MPRPVSWLPRLHVIQRSVENTVRSHYTRAELQQLFELQPRAAGKIIGLLPTTPVAGAYLVSRADLLDFLDRVRLADDVPALLRRMREEAMRPSRKKIRVLLRKSAAPYTLDVLPAGVSLSRGEARIAFGTVEELLQSMLTVALLVDDEQAEFIRRFEPVDEAVKAERDQGREDLRRMFARLREMEAKRGIPG